MAIKPKNLECTYWPLIASITGKVKVSFSCGQCGAYNEQKIPIKDGFHEYEVPCTNCKAVNGVTTDMS